MRHQHGCGRVGDVIDVEVAVCRLGRDADVVDLESTRTTRPTDFVGMPQHRTANGTTGLLQKVVTKRKRFQLAARSSGLGLDMLTA
jgi:hypothetical protein